MTKQKTYTQAQVNWLLMRAYKAGWKQGYWDNADHDCRMFEPIDTIAWDQSEVKEWCLAKAKRPPTTRNRPS